MSFTVRCGYFPRANVYELGTWDTFAGALYEAEKHRLMRADMDERPDWQEIVDSDPPAMDLDMEYERYSLYDAGREFQKLGANITDLDQWVEHQLAETLANPPREPDTVYRGRKVNSVNPNEWTDWVIETWGDENILDDQGNVLFSHTIHVVECE